MEHEYEYSSTNTGNSFEKKELFYKSLSRFSLKTRRFYGAQNDKRYDQGVGGVPLAWQEEDNSLYLDSSDAHTLIIGSTGSKKSRLVAIPTVKLLGYAGESLIISDPKAEIYNRTSKDLKLNGYDISVLNFRSPSESNAWNPLEIPYRFYCDDKIDKACEFVNDISVNLMLSEMSTKDPFWDYSASDLFFGLTLLLFKFCKENDKSFSSVNIGNLLRLRREMFSKHTSTYSIENTDIWEYAKDDELIYSSLIGTVGAPDSTQASILSTFDYKMRCFIIQPNLLNMLSSSNIALSNIGARKTALFLIMPDEKTSYHKLVALFIKQSYEYLIFKAQSLKNFSMPVRVNYLLDEFSSLPAIKDFSSMITAARSRNIRFNLIIQSKHQLIQRYGEEAETIQSNCTNWVFITSRELKLLDEISTLCGMRSNGNKPLISVFALQRFNKEKGEILVLSGRLKPFKTQLPDIDKYDNGEFEIFPFPSIESQNIEKIFSFKRNSISEPIDSSKKVPIEKRKKIDNNSNNKADDPLPYDVQKELEAKFDELFGTFNDDN